ncbi:McrC family protein [Actinomadura verrucosospora]|uniref:McrC family protein n=1 Tax=Actinomadura verrucosospora TaxID=46165 RepID=UPI0031EC832E
MNWFTGPNRVVIPCKEYGPIDVSSADVLGPDGRLLLTPQVLNKYVEADFVDGGLRLSAKGYSGLIPLTERIAIQVRPRFPLRNLTHMVAVCGYVPTMLSALRDYEATNQWNDWLLDVMADGLLAALDTISLNGLLRTYRRRTEAGSYPHGRINMTGSVLRYASQGINHKAEYSWFERTADNPPNRCLKSAVALLHSRYVNAPREKGIRERIARLAEAMRLLNDVSFESHAFSLDDPQVRGTVPLPETRAYYRPALELAVAILTKRGISLDVDKGRVSMPTLLVKTENLFEEFVRISLQENFSAYPTLSVLDGNREPGKAKLYEALTDTERTTLPVHEKPAVSGKEPDANPDIVFRMNDGAHPLIADVKYSNVKGYADRSEVEQVVLYGHRYRSPVTMTIHPRRSESKKGLYIAGRIGSTIVAQYRVDLGASNLEAEMNEMAKQISGLIASQAPLFSPPSPEPPPLA